MTKHDVQEHVATTLRAMQPLAAQIDSLIHDSAESTEASFRDRTATTAFLGQLYTGIESILIQVGSYRGVRVPTSSGPQDPLDQFTAGNQKALVPILTDELLSAFRFYRECRDGLTTECGVDYSWQRLLPPMKALKECLAVFETQLDAYLYSLPD